MRRIAAALAAFAVVALTAAGCGGGADTSGPATSTATEENRVQTTRQAQPAPARKRAAPERPTGRKKATAAARAPSQGSKRSPGSPPKQARAPKHAKRSPLKGARRPAASPYELPATVACLRQRGAKVRGVAGTDATLRSLRDLAQRTSRSVTLRGETAWLAVGGSVAEAQLLTDLLALPGQPYAVSRHGNAVVMRRVGKLQTSKTAVACLRP